MFGKKPRSWKKKVAEGAEWMKLEERTSFHQFCVGKNKESEWEIKKAEKIYKNPGVDAFIAPSTWTRKTEIETNQKKEKPQIGAAVSP